MYGLMIYDIDGDGQDAVSFGNKASIIETRTMNRIQPLHYGVNYHEEPLEFTLIFGTDHQLDRYELEDISLWLTGHQQYQWLSIDQDDLHDVEFRCLVTELKPVHFGWIPVAFEVTFICDCPYAYSTPFEKTYSVSSSSPTILFRNESSVREYFKPTLMIEPAYGLKNLSITNKDDNDRVMSFEGMPVCTSITIDNTNGIITESPHNYNMYPYFNMNFLRMVQGDNHLTVDGQCNLTFSGRFLRNVGA